jgi:hypothetical protein
MINFVQRWVGQSFKLYDIYKQFKPVVEALLFLKYKSFNIV